MDVTYLAKFTALVQLVVHVSVSSLSHCVLEEIPVCCYLQGWLLLIFSTPSHNTLHKLTQKELTLPYSPEVNCTLGHHKYKFSATWESKQSNQIHIISKASATLKVFFS